MRARHCRPAAVRRDVRTLDVGISLRESSFGVLMLVVMTTTAHAALLQGGQQYSPHGSSRWSAAKVLHFAGSAE